MSNVFSISHHETVLRKYLGEALDARILADDAEKKATELEARALRLREQIAYAKRLGKAGFDRSMFMKDKGTK